MIYLLCTSFFLFIIPFHVQAQVENTKIRYADIEYIFIQLPATKQIESELKSLQKQLDATLQTKYEEFNKKYAAYIENEKNMSEATRLATAKQLQVLEQNLQKSQQESQVALQRKQEELLEPVTKGIQAAIAAVAKENAYSFILNAGVGRQDMVLFGDPALDISALVLQKLGVTPKPVSDPIKN